MSGKSVQNKTIFYLLFLKITNNLTYKTEYFEENRNSG